MRNLIIPKGLSDRDAFAWIKANKKTLVSSKKMQRKEADGVHFSGYMINRSGQIVKDAMPSVTDENVIKNSTVINTALWYDSHGDVHLPGIWKKSLFDNSKRPVNDIPLLQEHKMTFATITADGSNVMPYTKTMTWKELGVDFPGETESLIFDNTITADRNPFMFNQYKMGYVKNHSVGMYYVTLDLAIGFVHADFKDENELFYKWIDLIPNAQEAKDDGMFWAVSEAKAIEGSSVPKGSNIITPVLNDKSTQIEPEYSTHDEPRSEKAFMEYIDKTTFLNF